MKKYTIELDEAQKNILLRALSLFTDVGAGELGAAITMYAAIYKLAPHVRDTMLLVLRGLKSSIGLHATAQHALVSAAVDERFRIAYDIMKTLTSGSQVQVPIGKLPMPKLTITDSENEKPVEKVPTKASGPKWGLWFNMWSGHWVYSGESEAFITLWDTPEEAEAAIPSYAAPDPKLEQWYKVREYPTVDPKIGEPKKWAIWYSLPTEEEDGAWCNSAGNVEVFDSPEEALAEQQNWGSSSKYKVYEFVSKEIPPNKSTLVKKGTVFGLWRYDPSKGYGFWVEHTTSQEVLTFEHYGNAKDYLEKYMKFVNATPMYTVVPYHEFISKSPKVVPEQEPEECVPCVYEKKLEEAKKATPKKKGKKKPLWCIRHEASNMWVGSPFSSVDEAMAELKTFDDPTAFTIVMYNGT